MSWAKFVVAALHLMVGGAVFAGSCAVTEVTPTPCAFSVTTPLDGSVDVTLELLFDNTNGASSFSWVVAPTGEGDPACLNPAVGPLFTTTNPFSGIVAPATTQLEPINLRIDSTGLGFGDYREYVCIVLDLNGVDPIAIPIDLTVSDLVFGDGFESN